MRYEINGQENVDLAFGAGGDKTLLVAVGSTHVQLQNYDPQQPVMYSIVDPPAVRADWRSLKPGATVMVWLNGAVKVYVRKKRWIRDVPLGAMVAGGSIPYPDDVTAAIELEEIDY